MEDIEALKALTGTATQFFIAVTAVFGIIGMILKQVFDKQKKADNVAELLSGLSKQISTLKEDLEKEINQNEKQLKELEFNSQRYFGEILKAVHAGRLDDVKQIVDKIIKYH